MRNQRRTVVAKGVPHHNHHTNAAPTVISATTMPIKPVSLLDSGLTDAFPAAPFADGELAPEVPEPVIAALGIPDGKPVLTPAAPSGGNGALASTAHPLAVDGGHAGGVIVPVWAAYAEEATPLGVKVAHWCWRFVKSGATGVGVPWRVYLDVDG
jgi:hypothetical protein